METVSNLSDDAPNVEVNKDAEGGVLVDILAPKMTIGIPHPEEQGSAKVTTTSRKGKKSRGKNVKPTMPRKMTKEDHGDFIQTNMALYELIIVSIGECCCHCYCSSKYV